MSANHQRRIAVIGGGISGLSAMLRLLADDQVDAQLFEAAARPGGTLQTERIGDFLVEHSADMFTTDEPDAHKLCQAVGIEDRLINTNAANRRAFVCWQGELHPVPPGFAMMSPTRLTSIWQTQLLSTAGKLRFMAEQHVPGGVADHGQDESLQSFAVRRFGREAFDKLIQPLIGGIYTADPQLLSMQATLKKFLDQEQRHGSLIAAARHAQSAGVAAEASACDVAEQGAGARYGRFVAPGGGMQELVDAIVARIPGQQLHLETPVVSITRVQSKAPSGTPSRRWLINNDQEFDGLIMALPSHRAAALLSDAEADLSADLAAIPHAGSAVVVQGYRRDQIRHPLDGFGFVVPEIERRKILACSFSSVKFAGRAPDDCVLIRSFVGGALQPELLDLDDDAITRLVETELAGIIGMRGTPIFSRVLRWTNAMPQYQLGHLDLVRRIESTVQALPDLVLAGNSLHGVGIPFCIRSGTRAAEKFVG